MVKAFAIIYYQNGFITKNIPLVTNDTPNFQVMMVAYTLKTHFKSY